MTQQERAKASSVFVGEIDPTMPFYLQKGVCPTYISQSLGETERELEDLADQAHLIYHAD